MDLEPHLIKKQSSELDPPLFDKKTEKLFGGELFEVKLKWSLVQGRLCFYHLKI